MEKPDKLVLLERKVPAVKAVVQDEAALKHIKIRQFLPAKPSSLPWLEHVWTIDWNMPEGTMHQQRTIPFPVFNLVADRRNGNALHGASRSYFEYPLSGVGHVVGIRMKPAMQGVFYHKPASGLTGNAVKADSVFSVQVNCLLDQLARGAVTIELMADCLLCMAAEARPLTAKMQTVNGIVQYIQDREELYRVSDLLDVFGVTERTLQRQFEELVGMSPKAVIERFRIQNAMQNCASGRVWDIAQLSASLGYFDQAHFTNAFVRVVGCTPLAYQRRCTLSSLSKRN